MKKQNRKAFTIVELVIVIAVIGILAAVLIPTFSGIIESANRTVDTQLVAQINTTLAVEDVLSGGINEVVDIQNAIKKHGLKLETKSKGAYLWYDRDSGKVVLGSLDENNNLEIIFGDDSEQSNSLKGKFDINMIALEGFIHGYYFISEESNDKFAEKICAVRNADDKDQLEDALDDVNDVNASVGQQFRVFMSTHPLITNSGVIFLGNNPANATTAIVGGNVTEITAGVIAELKNGGYTNIDHIDLHPGVTKVDSSISELNIDFFHSSSAVDTFCDDNGIDNVHLKGERDKFIQTLNLVYIDTDGEELEGWSGNNPELNKTKWKVTLTPWLDSQSTDTDKVYDFVGYSFENDSSVSISLGTSNYFLTEADKTKVNESTGAITIYAVYDVDTTPDFKIGNKLYGSRAVTYKLSIGAITSGTITVCSTDAVLDASMIGLANVTLTILSDVELLLPFKNNTKQGIAIANGGDTLVEMDFTADGSTKLTIAEGVNLVNQGSIYVDAQLYYHSTAVQSNIKKETSGVLEVNGSITSTGSITALGVIRGSGSIAANGGSVSEVMTIFDWHGGRDAATAVGATTTRLAGLAIDISGKLTTPFNNWRMQNVRVDVTINNKTNYKVITSINVGNAKPVEFLLAGPSDALFVMKSGSIVRTMSSEAINGKYNTKLIINGTVEDAEKTLKIEDVVSGVDAEISFAKIAMPLSHFDVEVTNKSNLTISKNIYKVLPGSNIVVDEGGTLNIGTKVAFYNSYELVHANEATLGQESGGVMGYGTIKRDITRYGVFVDDNGNLKCTEWTYKQTRSVQIGAAAPWANTSDMPVYGGEVDYNVSETTAAVTMPNTYPVTNRPAKLVVNGTVNFSSGAAFAGEIISETGNATISVASGVTVGGHLLPEGFFDTNNTQKWYYTAVKGLHNFACLNGVEQSLSGTYTSTYDELLGRYTWSDK